MVQFFGTGEYSFVSEKGLVVYGTGDEHDTLIRSSKSRLFLKAVSEASFAIESSTRRASKRLRSSRIAIEETKREEAASTHDIVRESHGSDPALLSDANHLTSGGESPEADLPHYEKLRQDNMRRNNEILEVHWIPCMF